MPTRFLFVLLFVSAKQKKIPQSGVISGWVGFISTAAQWPFFSLSLPVSLTRDSCYEAIGLIVICPAFPQKGCSRHTS